MIGRRLLVRSDSMLASIHYTIQIAFGWTDSHLHGVDPTVVSPAAIWRRRHWSERDQLQIPSNRLPTTRV
jgi:hypothetical protein